MSNVFDYDESGIEITDYSDLDNTVKTIIVTAITDTIVMEMAGGTKGQALTKKSEIDGDFIWADIVNSIQQKIVIETDVPYLGANIGDSYLEITRNADIISYIPLVHTYNSLTDKPIINQNLDSLLFIPEIGTYYRHVGTTDTYIYGKIYYYDGERYSAITSSYDLYHNLLNYYTKTQLDLMLSAINDKIPASASAENQLVDRAQMESFAMPITTKYGANLSLEFNKVNGKLIAQLKDQDGNNIGQAQTVTIDLQSIENTINGILDLIPAQASSSNQLTDKDFVNSSISTNTANFIGTFENLASLKAYSGTVTNNDYANVINSVVTNNGADFISKAELDAYPTTNVTNFDYAWVINGNKFDLYRYDLINEVWELRVEHTDKDAVTLNTVYNRYKANVINSVITWNFEFTINTTTFTAVQWAAINSGITAGLVSAYNAHIANKNNPHEVTKSQVGLGNVANERQYSADNPNFSSNIPQMDGIASAGSATTYAHSDHIHPSDTSKQNVIDSTHKLNADYTEDGTTNKVFTATEQSKLSGIESGAQVNTVDSVNGKTGTVVLDADDISDTGTINKFVTETEKSTWNAKQNALTFDSTPTASSTNPVTSEGIKTAIDNAIVAVYKPQGKSSVSTLNGLTKTASMNGYVYDLTDAGTLNNYDGTTEAVHAKDNVVFLWNNGDWYWDNFGEVVDLSGYVQKITEIAGIQISTGISAQSLTDALVFMNNTTDINDVMED